MRRKQVIGNGQRRLSRAEAEQLVDAFEVSGLQLCRIMSPSLRKLSFRNG